MGGKSDVLGVLRQVQGAENGRGGNMTDASGSQDDGTAMQLPKNPFKAHTSPQTGVEILLTMSNF